MVFRRPLRRKSFRGICLPQTTMLTVLLMLLWFGHVSLASPLAPRMRIPLVRRVGGATSGAEVDLTWLRRTIARGDAYAPSTLADVD